MDSPFQPELAATDLPRAEAIPVADLDIAYAALEALEENAAKNGISVHYETDFDEFVRLRSMSSDGVVNPMLNPHFSKVDRDAFWLRAMDRNGDLIALFGTKVFHTDDVMELVRNERLWYDRSPVHAVDPRAQPLPAFSPFGGLISHGAGLWTAPHARVRGLSTFLSDYSRALLIKNWPVDWHTMTCIEAYRDQSARAYGFELALLFDGWCTMMGRETRLYLGRMPRPEIMERLRSPTLLKWAETPARVAAVR